MATFAGRYDEVLFKHVGNRVIPATSASVTVYESDGSTEASLYTDRTKATAADNPVDPDSAGNLEFFADPGTYVLSISEDSSVVATNTVTVVNDPAESGEHDHDADYEALVSRTGATTGQVPKLQADGTLAFEDDNDSGGGGGTSDHGALTGLGDDDHTQYALADGTRGTFATTAQGTLADSALQPGDIGSTVQAHDANNVSGDGSVLDVVEITQANYDLLSPPVATTLYCIVG